MLGQLQMHQQQAGIELGFSHLAGSVGVDDGEGVLHEQPEGLAPRKDVPARGCVVFVFWHNIDALPSRFVATIVRSKEENRELCVP